MLREALSTWLTFHLVDPSCGLPWPYKNLILRINAISLLGAFSRMVAFKAEKNDGILDQFTRVSNMLVDPQKFMPDIKQGYQRLLGISLQILVAEVALQSGLVSGINLILGHLGSFCHSELELG